MRSVAVSVLLALLVVGGIAVAATGPAGATIDDGVDEPSEPILVYEISVDANGSANWTITAKFPIAEDAQREAFDRLAANYLDGDDDDYLSSEPYVMAAGELAERLNREMAIEETNRTVGRSDDIGRLELSFEWVGFAETDDRSVTVGDVFAATERPWLSTLQDDEFLRIHAPPGYAIDTSGMPVSNRTVWMDGPADLSASELQSVFVREAAHGGSGNDTGDGGGLAGMAILPFIGGAIGILGILGVALFVGLWAGWAPITAAVAAVREDDSESSVDVPVGESLTTDEADPADGELLSDEERVLALIDDNGGRMKQGAIVTETDWSNAKVSQLLSEMAEAGAIEKLRIGRENLISLRDQENDR